MKKKKPSPDVAQALAILKAEQDKRVRACQEELQAVLKKHNCQIVPQIGIVAN